jgi:hydrogenase expression/formation protein HypC
MCLLLPGKILELVDTGRRVARVDVLGASRRVNLSALDDVGPGDWVLIQLGFAIEKISEAEGLETARALQEMASAFEDDLLAAMPKEGAT